VGGSACSILVLVSTSAGAEPITFRIRGRVLITTGAVCRCSSGGRFEIVYTLSQPHRDANPGDPRIPVFYSTHTSRVHDG